ncbi:MAG: TolB family protein [bacterium]
MRARWVPLLVLVALICFLCSCSTQPQEILYFLSYSRLENRGELFKAIEGKTEKLYEKPGLVDFAPCGDSFYLLTRTPTKSALYSLNNGKEQVVKESSQTMIFLKPSFPEAPLAVREIGKERETLHLLSSEGIENSFIMPKGALALSISPQKELALRIWESSGKKRLAKIYLMDLKEPNPYLFRPALSEDSSEEFLSWSPKGGEFLFQRKTSTGTYSLFIYNLREKRETLFRENAFSFQGALTGGESWSLDGHIIYSYDSQKEVFSEIYLAREGKEWQVGAKGASPYLSPDGEVLAFATPSERKRPGENAPPQADLGIYFLKEEKTFIVNLEGDCLSPVSASWSDSSRFFAFVTYIWNENQGPSGFKLYLYERSENSCQAIFYDPTREILTLAWKAEGTR